MSRIIEDPKDAVIREFKEEINRLKAELASKGSGGDSNQVEKRIVEKVVEVDKEVIVDTGISADDLKAIEARMKKYLSYWTCTKAIEACMKKYQHYSSLHEP